MISYNLLCKRPGPAVQGLELYGLQPKQQGLAYIERRPHPVRWCSYSHEARMALLGTGEGGHWVQVTNQTYPKLWSWDNQQRAVHETCTEHRPRSAWGLTHWRVPGCLVYRPADRLLGMAQEDTDIRATAVVVSGLAGDRGDNFF